VEDEISSRHQATYGAYIAYHLCDRWLIASWWNTRVATRQVRGSAHRIISRIARPRKYHKCAHKYKSAAPREGSPYRVKYKLSWLSFARGVHTGVITLHHLKAHHLLSFGSLAPLSHGYFSSCAFLRASLTYTRAAASARTPPALFLLLAVFMRRVPAAAPSAQSIAAYTRHGAHSSSLPRTPHLARRGVLNSGRRADCACRLAW